MLPLTELRNLAAHALLAGRIKYPYFLYLQQLLRDGKVDEKEFLSRLENPTESFVSDREWFYQRGLGWRPIESVSVRPGLL